MGFTKKKAVSALRQANNDVNNALQVSYVTQNCLWTVSLSWSIFSVSGEWTCAAYPASLVAPMCWRASEKPIHKTIPCNFLSCIRSNVKRAVIFSLAFLRVPIEWWIHPNVKRIRRLCTVVSYSSASTVRPRKSEETSARMVPAASAEDNFCHRALVHCDSCTTKGSVLLKWFVRWYFDLKFE